jgi:putative oxidoreductase
MKMVSLIARILLSILFLVFGMNGFLHFIPMGPLPTSLAGEFMDALMKSHYMLVVSALEVLGGFLVLIPRLAPLGLVILGPIVFNIMLVHIFLIPAGLPLAIITALFWIGSALPYRSALLCLVSAKIA